MLFSLLRNNSVIGLFDDFDKCNDMMTGLVRNNLVKETDLIVRAFKTNSIVPVRTPNVYMDSESEESDSDVSTTEEEPVADVPVAEEPVVEEPVVEETPEEKEARLAREKRRGDRRRKREYNLSLLKKKKEKLEEQKRIFNIDLDLYNKFKKIFEENPKFQLPDMFERKYEIMSELEKLDKLNCDNFYAVYEDVPMPNKWSMLFSGPAKERELLEVSDDTDEE